MTIADCAVPITGANRGIGGPWLRTLYREGQTGLRGDAPAPIEGSPERSSFR